MNNNIQYFKRPGALRNIQFIDINIVDSKPLRFMVSCKIYQIVGLTQVFTILM